MAKKYYGWIGTGGYKNVVIVEDLSEARVFNKVTGEFEVDNEFLKAAWDPGSDFEEITEAEAQKIMKEMEK